MGRVLQVMTISRGAAVLLLSLLGGCGGEDTALPSVWYLTSEIYAGMKAVQYESGSVLTTVELRNGASDTADTLYLGEGEYLLASLNTPPAQLISFSDDLFANGHEVSNRLSVMQRRDRETDFVLFSDVASGKQEYYAVDHSGGAVPPVRAYVSLERNGLQTGPSSIELPPPFHILSPDSSSAISRSDPVYLSWSDIDATSTMVLDVAGVCSDDTHYALNIVLGSDTGEALLDSADYFLPSGLDAQSHCRLAFLLKRLRVADVSPEFGLGGYFLGVQQRTVEFTSTP